MNSRKTNLVIRLLFVVFPTLILGISFGGILERRDMMPDFRATANTAKQVVSSLRLIDSDSLAQSENRAGFKATPGKIEITLFTDYQCPYCRKLHATIMKDIDASIRIRNLPLGFHPEALERARLVECINLISGERTASLAADYVFDNFENTIDWADAASAVVDDTNKLIAIQNCTVGSGLQAEEVTRTLKKDSIAVKLLGLLGTPSFVVNNQVFSGAYSADVINRVVEEIKTKK